ncbi:MAG: response regulator [Candidatus Obscuribacterales bacterium]|nr:response regulator [Candidatus Obscuribacterales bacterium]
MNGPFLNSIEEELAMLSFVFDSIEEGVAVWDCLGKFQYRNRAAKEIYGLADVPSYPPEDWVKSFGCFLSDGVTPYELKDLPAYRALHGEDVPDAEVFLRNETVPNGLLLRCNTRTLRNKEGEIIGALCIFSDVTAKRAAESNIRKLNIDLQSRVTELNEANQSLQMLTMELERARDQALESSRIKSQFVANISHEIRTPLAAVIGLTEILLSQTLKDEEALLALQCHKSAQSLLEIVNDILDFSKIEADKLGLDIGDFDLRAMVAETVELFERQAEEKKLQLSMAVDSDVPQILSGDSVRLKQILTNLLSNSVKFTERGEINVVVRLVARDDGHATVEFSVSDTGIGLSQEEIETLFRPFVQVNGESTRKQGGTGLGLSISKRLTELMVGEISVESKKGVGSRFWFVVNLRVPDISADSDVWKSKQKFLDTIPPASAVNADRAAKEVLIVEDNAVLQKLITFQLRHLGLTGEVASTGLHALEAFKKKKFCLILMDVQMPEMDGFQATLEIRKLEAGSAKHTPIVALTASAMEGDRERCLAAGMDDYLVKPVKLDRFKEVVEKWINR